MLVEKGLQQGLGRGGGGISHLCHIFVLFCYAFETKNTSKMTQIERTGKKVNLFMYHVLNQEMTVNVKMVMMEHLWCDIFVVVLIQKQLLLNIRVAYFSVVNPSVGH